MTVEYWVMMPMEQSLSGAAVHGHHVFAPSSLGTCLDMALVPGLDAAKIERQEEKKTMKKTDSLI